MLIDAGQAMAFLSVAILLTLAPGPDNLMVLSISLAQGRKAGMAFALGCACGCFSHTLVATLGIGALLAAEPPAFFLVKLAGGIYLLWLGFRILHRSGAFSMEPGLHGKHGLKSLFVSGLFANALNPKVMLFFLALLPQFVQSGRGPAAIQMLQFGLIFTIQAIVLFGVLGYYAGSAGGWLARRPEAGLWMGYLAGAILILLGLRLVLE